MRHQNDSRTIFIDRDDLKILACGGEVSSLDVKLSRSDGTWDPVAKRKKLMEQAIGHAVSELIQWTEETMPDGSIKLRAELSCLKKDPRHEG